MTILIDLLGNAERLARVFKGRFQISSPVARDNRRSRIAAMMTPSDLQPVVDQTVWWEPARSQAKVDLEFFLPYAMAYATDEALSLIRRHVSDDQLRAALRGAPIGLFDLQSWQ